jgi:hypothetical protein
MFAEQGNSGQRETRSLCEDGTILIVPRLNETTTTKPRPSPH